MSPRADQPSFTPEHRLTLLETLLDRVPDFFYVHNAELRFQYANRAAASYFGRPKSELPGLLHREVDDNPEQAAYFEAELIPIIERGEPVTTGDLPFTRGDGSPGLLQAHIVPFDHPVTGERMMLGISRDVTEERRAAAEREARAAYERELEIAHLVQRSLLPASPPEVVGFEIAARCEPAMYAGGDFYDFIVCPDGRMVAVLGDVTGHGVGPALIAASCRAYARAVVPRMSLTGSIKELDRLVTADAHDGSFVTFAAIELTPGERTVRYCSAGHGPVAHVGHTGAVRVLPTQTLPLGLGIAAASAVEGLELRVEAGERVLLPSDGLIESRGADGVQWGMERLAVACAGETAEEAVEQAYAADEAWRGGTPADDDQSLVVIGAS
ncbi:MAG: SpoIIE family protein phosphatase [Planctomycetota bacterium]